MLQLLIKKAAALIQKHLRILVVKTCLSQKKYTDQKQKQHHRFTFSIDVPGACGDDLQENQFEDSEGPSNSIAAERAKATRKGYGGFFRTGEAEVRRKGLRQRQEPKGPTG